MSLNRVRRVLGVTLTASFFSVVGSFGLSVSESRADVDLSGPWVVNGTFGITSFMCDSIGNQTGTSLNFISDCGISGSFDMSGTIDPVTGVFTVTDGEVEVTGVGAADSLTFTGTFTLLSTGGTGTFDGTRCGNGQLDAGEICDDDIGCCDQTTCQFEPSGTACASDGNVCTDDECDGAGTCVHPPSPTAFCTTPGEQGTCPGGEVCTDDCSACVPAGCGNGATELGAGEECDHGGESATCDADCTLVVCGDGTHNATAGEGCDDGNPIEGDGCDTNCTPTGCGNGITSPGEECDDAGQSSTCDADCTFAVCGDGTLNGSANEECDDGGTVDGDGCEGDCQLPCPASIANCLGDVARYAVVADKFSVRAGKIPEPGYGGYNYAIFSYVEGSVCATSGKFKGHPEEWTEISGDVILLKESGTAGRFKGLRRSYYGYLYFFEETVIEGDLITGGGTLKGLEHVVVYGDIDTTGTHPKLEQCRQAMAGLRAASDFMRDWTPAQDLGSKLTVPTGEELSIHAGGTGTHAFNLNRLTLQSRRASDGDIVGSTVNVTADPTVDSVIVNVKDSLLVQRNSELDGTADVIVNLHGPKSAVKIEKGGEGFLQTSAYLPILAPGGKIVSKHLSNTCELWGQKVKLIGTVVEECIYSPSGAFLDVARSLMD